MTLQPFLKVSQPKLHFKKAVDFKCIYLVWCNVLKPGWGRKKRKKKHLAALFTTLLPLENLNVSVHARDKSWRSTAQTRTFVFPPSGTQLRWCENVYSAQFQNHLDKGGSKSKTGLYYKSHIRAINVFGRFCAGRCVAVTFVSCLAFCFDQRNVASERCLRSGGPEWNSTTQSEATG